MQVRLIKDCFGPNPKFDKTRLAGPGNPREVTVPKGTILDHPLAFMHCRGEDPNAEPFDDEAKQHEADYQAWRQKMIEAAAVDEPASEPAGEDDDQDGDESAGQSAPITPILPLPDASAAVEVPAEANASPVAVVVEDAPADASAVVKSRRR